ncbi:CoA-binding protein [Chloroflexota bacterium]
MKDFARLDRAFNPRSIAVIGDNGRNNFMWLRAQSTYKGKLYSVHINPATVERIQKIGIPNYSSILDIPEPVDLAIVAVPRKVALQTLEDCIHKGVAAAHYYTAGFAETDTEEGRQLEYQLAERAKRADFYLIGPNCLGILNPKLGIRQREEQCVDVSGPVGFISQSGNHTVTFSIEGHLQGVDIDKAISYGNGVVLDAPVFLEYFGQDEGIKVIGMYLEGVRDGRRFLRVLKEVSAKKPVVIWKGGRTEAGGRAIASHTASLAVSQAVWDSAVRQAGALAVSNLEELIDTIKALEYLSSVTGDRVALAGGSGGQSVAITDAFAEAGLTVPLLTRESYDRFAAFFNLVGASCRNPIDPGANRREIGRIMDILEQDANIDNLVLIVWLLAWQGASELLDKTISSMIKLRQRTAKPLMVITPTFSTPENLQQLSSIACKFQGGGIPVFSTVERAARALRNALEYYKFKSRT